MKDASDMNPQAGPASTHLDRPSQSVPSVDTPWDDPADRAHRLSVIGSDRSTHRAFHSLYEDMLN
ncbi:MAG: hypothetical protein AAF376_13040 [Pseudomonadota bacterium]